MQTLPGGDEWLAAVNERPVEDRHLAVHTGHLIALNDADHAAWNAGGSALIDQLTITGTANEVRDRWSNNWAKQASPKSFTNPPVPTSTANSTDSSAPCNNKVRRRPPGRAFYDAAISTPGA